MAHALWNYDGACRNIHGHSYKLFVTVAGDPISEAGHPKFGMVLDFGDLKQLVNEPVVDFLDHSLVVYSKSEGETLEAVRALYEKVHVFDFQPTCENLVLYIVEIIKNNLPTGVELCAVKLYETATSFAEWISSDNK
jgi:6-pyruvoyltetrahydropterin/6-carboxytetrahydropterin synthase